MEAEVPAVRCTYCWKRGHILVNCPDLQPSSETLERLVRSAKGNPEAAEELARRRAHKKYGTDPELPRRRRWRWRR